VKVREEGGVRFPRGAVHDKVPRGGRKAGPLHLLSAFRLRLVRTAQADDDFILKLFAIDNPDVVVFGMKEWQEPENAIPKLRSAGWKITNAGDEQVEATYGDFVLTVTEETIELTGFSPGELLGAVEEPEEEAGMLQE
jgi:hypothetical protein